MNYEDHSAEDLRKLAADREISGRSEMNKAELVQALTLADGNEVGELRPAVEALGQRVAALESRIIALETFGSRLR